MAWPTYLNETAERKTQCREIGLANRKHGASIPGSPLYKTYRSWQSLKNRCSNPRNNDWQYYGGRGISFDPSWSSFEVFLADMGPRPDATTLDRIDPDGDYSKGNCRWADAFTQSANRRPRKG